MVDKIPAPAPGLYCDVPFDVYRSWDALNISTLLWATCSMEHVKASLDGILEDDPSEAKLFGSALHCRVLEPDAFGDRFVVAPPCEAVLKSGKSAGAVCGKRATYLTADGSYVCGTHAPSGSHEPDNLLTADQMERIDAINHKIRQHPVVKLIRQHGGFECSLVWQQQDVLCKARLDKYIFHAQCPDVIVDLKKVQLGAAGDATFARAILNYHYHAKAAWYADGAKAINGIDPLFIWLVVEDKPPYGVNVIHCDAETMKIGRYINSVAFERYRLCREQDEWPGYCSDIHLGGLPEWERKNFKGILDMEPMA